MKVFVVSLERAKDRRVQITKHLNALNINYELFDAIDGQQLTPSTLAEYCDMETINKYPNWLTPGMIGCCLSHYFIYKKIVEEDISFACILEDDAIVVEEFNRILEEIEKNTAKNCLTMLHYASWTELRLKKTNNISVGKHVFYEPEEIKKMNSTAGYVVTKEICERLIDILLPIHMGPDSWQEMLEAKGFSRITCIYPRPVNTVHAKSTLDYVKSTTLLGKVANLIDQHKVFPMYQLLKYKRKNFSEKMRRVTIVSSTD